MLFDYLDSVRKKPLHARKRFAFSVAFVFTGIVAFIWIFTLPARLSSVGGAGNTMMASPGAQQFEEQFVDEAADAQQPYTLDEQAVQELPPELLQQLEQSGLLQVQNPTATSAEGIDPTLTVTESTGTTPRPIIIETVTATTSVSSTTPSL